jgi:hypothetical protein
MSDLEADKAIGDLVGIQCDPPARLGRSTRASGTREFSTPKSEAFLAAFALLDRKGLAGVAPHPSRSSVLRAAHRRMLRYVLPSLGLG